METENLVFCEDLVYSEPWCCLICAVLVEGLVCVNKKLATCHYKVHRGWEKNLRKHMQTSINNMNNLLMNQSSYIASHTRQKPKRGEDVFNAKIARITDGNRESGLLWGSCLVSTLVLCCCHICAVLMECLFCVSEHMSLKIHRGREKTCTNIWINP